MWVIYLEMAVVLCIALLIVWWTWPKKKKQNLPGPGDSAPGSERNDER